MPVSSCWFLVWTIPPWGHGDRRPDRRAKVAIGLFLSPNEKWKRRTDSEWPSFLRPKRRKAGERLLSPAVAGVGLGKAAPSAFTARSSMWAGETGEAGNAGLAGGSPVAVSKTATGMGLHRAQDGEAAKL